VPNAIPSAPLRRRIGAIGNQYVLRYAEPLTSGDTKRQIQLALNIQLK